MSLGTLTASDLPDPDRAKAIFALPAQRSQPTGPHRLWRLGAGARAPPKIVPGVTRTLDDVREEIRKNLLTQLVGNKMVDAVNAFTDARGNGDDLAAAAKKAGMRIGRAAAVNPAATHPKAARAKRPPMPVPGRRVQRRSRRGWRPLLPRPAAAPYGWAA